MPTQIFHCHSHRGNIQMATKTLKKYLNKSASPIVDSFFELKELSLVSHIETLKKIATNEDSPNHNYDCSSNNTCLPALLNATLNTSEQTKFVSTHLQNRPLSSSWAIDPALVKGNLRNETSKQGNLSIEEILSRGSSVSEKAKDDNEDHPDVDKSFIKARRKSLRSSKKRKKKNASSTVLQSNTSPTAALTVLPKFPKGALNISNSSNTNDINGLSAFCQGVTIHEKTQNTSSLKKSHDKPKLHNTHNVSSRQSHSLAAKSLNDAIVEYSKRQASQTEGTHHKKKGSSGVEDEAVRMTKVFLSEKQSGVISDSGISYPCAPPATPTADQLRKYEYVPSLHDIRSQRSVRQRLQLMENRAQKKEKKKHDDSMRLDQMSVRDRKFEMKRRQRLEVYALNKVMTELEHERFIDFMSSAGSNI